MENAEQLSVRRRTLDVEDYIDILRRHRHWILAPTVAGLVLGVVVAFLWPDRYVSEAVIRVVPSQVPSNLVPHAETTTQMVSRINWIYAQILSRNVLQNVIQTHNLYPEEKNKRPNEDIVEDMRRDLVIAGVTSLASTSRSRQESPGFKVTFKYRNRFLAQKVTNDLVGRIIDENVRARTNQIQTTSNFLEDQVASAKKVLDEIEGKITEYRMRNIGQTPEQLTMNYQQLNANEMRISSLQAALGRLSQEKLSLETELRTNREKIKLLSNMQETVTAGGVRISSPGGNRALEAVEREIQQRENTLASLRERWTENHPDFKRYTSDLANLKRQRDNLIQTDAAAASASAASAKPEEAQPVRRLRPETAREIVELEGNVARLQTQIQNKDQQVEDINNEIASTLRAGKALTARIQASPVGEAELATLMRDKALAQKNYEQLSLNHAQSEIMTDLEARKQGEMLELLDPASLPATPDEPKRPVIIGGMFAGGIVLGLVLAGIREVKDTSLKNLKDVRAYTRLTVLGSVPLLENDLVVRRRRRLAWLGWSAASLAAVVLMSGAIYYYHFVAKV